MFTYSYVNKTHIFKSLVICVVCYVVIADIWNPSYLDSIITNWKVGLKLYARILYCFFEKCAIIVFRIFVTFYKGGRSGTRLLVSELFNLFLGKF